MTLSLHKRLLLASSLVLSGFIALTGLTLDKAFQASARSAQEERLQERIYALLAEAELSEQGILYLPTHLQNARFSNPGSGLYAQVIANAGNFHWQSPSTLGESLATPAPLLLGQRSFDEFSLPSGPRLYRLRLGVNWEDEQGQGTAYTFSITEDQAQYLAQISAFRRPLWGWLLALAAGLLALQGSILRWSLTPLRQAAKEVAEIESGQTTQLQGHYPSELQGLTINLNALIHSERTRRERYRNSLGDLAHSLKTPLAILRGLAEGKQQENIKPVLAEQVDLMTKIVDYQLQRAAASGRSAFAAAVPVRPLAEKILATLGKVYADKQVQYALNVEEDCQFYGDQGDLLECLGNLCDNAFKWCHGQVQINLQSPKDASCRQPGLYVEVLDDGPGMPVGLEKELLQRGGRADQSREGQGIGLAVVGEIAQLYDGQLRLGKSTLGGGRVRLQFPPA